MLRLILSRESTELATGFMRLGGLRGFGKKKIKGNKRSQYALRRKEEIEGYKRHPFGIEGRPVKHFDELKFYHARNEFGQKETLIDGRRRDIDFFDPVRGGFELDPRDRYGGSKESAELDDEEASLYADFSETDEDDIYFGGGIDEDGDYDKDGRELRPRGSEAAKRRDVSRGKVEDFLSESDSDEDDREFNEVFGIGSASKTDKQIISESKRRPQGADLFAEASLSSDRPSRRSEFAPDYTQPDVDLGISPQRFKKQFEGENPNLSDDLLEEGDSSGEEESDMDEAMMEAGQEQMEELMDVSDMIRDFDRPRKLPRALTEEEAEEFKREAMEFDEDYESDDLQDPYQAEDLQTLVEIQREEDEHVRRLKSTYRGRKTYKKLTKELKFKEDFPECDKRLYEDALERTPMEGPPRKRSQSKPVEERRAAPSVYVAAGSESPDLWRKAPRKASDSFRTLSGPFEKETGKIDIYSDVQEDDRRRDVMMERKRAESRYRGRRRRPYGGTGVRYFSR